MSEDRLRPGVRSLELGYSLAEEFWGPRSYDRSCKARHRIRIRIRGLDVMMIRTGEENIASQRIIEKCGFQYEGTLRRIYKIYDGTVKPVRCYTMLRKNTIASGMPGCFESAKERKRNMAKKKRQTSA